MQGQPCAKKGADGRLSQDPSWQLGVMGGGWSLEEACGDPEEHPRPALKAGLRAFRRIRVGLRLQRYPETPRHPEGLHCAEEDRSRQGTRVILSAETVIPKRVLKALRGQGPAEQTTLTLHEPRVPKMWGGAAALEEDASTPGSDPC